MYSLILVYQITEFGVKIFGKYSENKPTFLLATVDYLRRIHCRGNVASFGDYVLDFCFYVATRNLKDEQNKDVYSFPIQKHKEIYIYIKSIDIHDLGYVVKQYTIPLL